MSNAGCRGERKKVPRNGMQLIEFVRKVFERRGKL
jgi:hypothetical protein